jgi:hypothetical protein
MSWGVAGTGSRANVIGIQIERLDGAVVEGPGRALALDAE